MEVPMRDAAAAIEFVLDAIEDPSKRGVVTRDSGGITRWGISQKAHPGVDVEHLSRAGAVDIYRRSYWGPCGAESLPLPLALLVYDAAVNQGVLPAVLMLQRVLGVTADGIVGPRTAFAARNRPSAELRARYAAARLEAYEKLAGERPYYRQYLHQWRFWVARVVDEAGRWSAWE
jgi:lysozyme family protein